MHQKKVTKKAHKLLFLLLLLKRQCHKQKVNRHSKRFTGQVLPLCGGVSYK